VKQGFISALLFSAVSSADAGQGRAVAEKLYFIRVNSCNLPAGRQVRAIRAIRDQKKRRSRFSIA